MLEKTNQYKIKNAIADKTRDNKSMKKFYLQDTISKEEYKCVIWEDTLALLDEDAIKNGNIIEVTSFTYKEAFKTYTINKLNVIKKSPVGLLIEEREKIFERLIKEIENFKNESLKKATLETIIEQKELLLIAPAAEKLHHNYVGGLLLHILECINYAKTIINTSYQKLDEDLLICACIIHDIGKIFEYIIKEDTGEICRNPDFDKSWLSHIYYGFSWANNHGFSELAHIIASHHGRIEWGAIVEPNTIEARVFHHIDDLSAYTGHISADEIEDLNI